MMDHDDDDNYEESYDDDPFDLYTQVDTLQAFASKFTPRKGPGNFNDRVHTPKDKWFGLNQKTKEIWNQIDDKYRSVFVGFTSISTLLLVNHQTNLLLQILVIISNLHEMSAYDFYRRMIMKSHLRTQQMSKILLLMTQALSHQTLC
jgi:hypothetical protein